MFNRFQYHKKLFPKIWDKNEQLKTNVHQTLSAIIKEYIFYLSRVIKLPISESDFSEIFLHGSITNYYWDKHSDIDICIFADLSKIKQQLCGINDFLLFNALLSAWQRNFNIVIFGRNVDIWLIDNSEKEYCFNNTIDTFYSLSQNKWHIKPKRLTKTEVHNLKQKAYKKYHIIMRQCRKILKNNPQPAELDKYLITIKRYRENSAHNPYGQPITSGVVAFKMARNTGIFIKMRKLSKKKLSKPFILR